MKIFTKVILALALVSSLAAQQPAKDTADQPAKDQSAKKEVLAGGDGLTGNFFKLALVIYELDDGKRTNQRDYMMIGRTENLPSSIRVATRVPITTEEKGKDKAYTYIDAGLNIRCSMKEQVDRRLQFHCDIEMSSFVRPEQIASSGNNIPPAPVLRTTRTESWALLTLGKPAALTTVDDINSTKRMQIEVTATKID
ncbi:MAG TPA: hypothetical protein VFQ41_12825 [Candidatus Angelobacter sp.]|nr:hypothetical protein [Candidatus Angelobacter sp.]